MRHQRDYDCEYSHPRRYMGGCRRSSNHDDNVDDYSDHLEYLDGSEYSSKEDRSRSRPRPRGWAQFFNGFLPSPHASEVSSGHGVSRCQQV